MPRYHYLPLSIISQSFQNDADPVLELVIFNRRENRFRIIKKEIKDSGGERGPVVKQICKYHHPKKYPENHRKTKSEIFVLVSNVGEILGKISNPSYDQSEIRRELDFYFGEIDFQSKWGPPSSFPSFKKWLGKKLNDNSQASKISESEDGRRIEMCLNQQVIDALGSVQQFSQSINLKDIADQCFKEYSDENIFRMNFDMKISFECETYGDNNYYNVRNFPHDINEQSPLHLNHMFVNIYLEPKQHPQSDTSANYISGRQLEQEGLYLMDPEDSD